MASTSNSNSNLNSNVNQDSTSMIQDPSSSTSSSSQSVPLSSTSTASSILPSLLLSSLLPASLYSSTCSNELDHTDPHERLSSTLLQLPSMGVRALVEACRNLDWYRDQQDWSCNQPPIQRVEEGKGNDTVPKENSIQIAEEGITGTEEEEKPVKRQSVAEAVKALEARHSSSNDDNPSRSLNSSPSSKRINRKSLENEASASGSGSNSSTPIPHPISTFNSNHETKGKGKERAFDLSCLLQRSADVISGLATSKSVDLILGRVVFDSLEEVMEGGILDPSLKGTEREQGGGEDEMKSKDFIRNGLSICVVAEEEAVFFGITHVSCLFL